MNIKIYKTWRRSGSTNDEIDNFLPEEVRDIFWKEVRFWKIYYRYIRPRKKPFDPFNFF